MQKKTVGRSQVSYFNIPHDDDEMATPARPTGFSAPKATKRATGKKKNNYILSGGYGV
jgi:hypothetical protein